MSNVAIRPTAWTIEYGDLRIPVNIRYRSGDRLTVHVHPDQRVVADVPEAHSLERVASRLKARASWIVRQLRHFEQFKPAPVPKRYVSGETLLYLGRQYRLRVRKADRPSVAMKGRFLCVEVRDPADRSCVKELVSRWYRTRASELLGDRFAMAVTRTSSLGLPTPQFRLRRMLTRWGSCTKAGTVLLNPDLVMVPSQCVDYVIIHELCHRKVLRHNTQFYELLARYLPDWRRRKDRLDQFVIPEETDGPAH